jgi:hypothetical protein
MYNHFFKDFALFLKNYNIIDNIKECVDIENPINKEKIEFLSLKFNEIYNQINDIGANSNPFILSFDNSLRSRKIITALQAIFGSFTGYNFKNNNNMGLGFKSDCALIMITEKICTPFYLNFLETDELKKEFIQYFVNRNIVTNQSCDILSKFLRLRSGAISSFLSIDGNFINLYSNDYKEFDGYINCDQKIFEIQNKYKNNLIYKKNKLSDNKFKNNAFYIIRRRKVNSEKSVSKTSDDLVFIINVKNAQISSNEQMINPIIEIHVIEHQTMHENKFSKELLEFLKDNELCNIINYVF